MPIPSEKNKRSDEKESRIRTTGQLRNYLAKVLLDVSEGRIDPDKGRTIVKVAAQINESFYSEVKIASVQHEAGKVFAELGNLELGPDTISQRDFGDA